MSIFLAQHDGKPVIKRRQTIRRGLFCVACLATLIAIFYTEENWRGRRAWQKCRAELVAKGWEFDVTKLIPPPVPDELNFTRTPLLAAIGIKGQTDTNHPAYGHLARFGRSGLMNVFGSTEGEPPDFARGVADLKRNGELPDPTPTGAPAELVRDLLEAYLGAELAELRIAASRPHATFPADATKPSLGRIPNFVVFRQCAQALALAAEAEFALGRIDAGCTNLLALERLGEAAETQRMLLGVMIGTAIRGLEVNALAGALRSQSWSDAQLERLQQLALRAELLLEFDRGMRAERAAFTALLEVNPDFMFQDLFDIKLSWRSRLEQYATRLFTPRGWRFQNLTTHNRWVEVCIFAGYDSKLQLVRPREVEQNAKAFTKRLGRVGPYNYQARVGIPHTAKALCTVAFRQLQLRLAALACALERHRLARGGYPESLTQLVPQFITEIPNDIINGQPLHYRRNDDGTFLLYSVGWNETDDGGTPSPRREEGDWVWVQPRP